MGCVNIKGVLVVIETVVVLGCSVVVVVAFTVVSTVVVDGGSPLGEQLNKRQGSANDFSLIARNICSGSALAFWAHGE